MPRRHQVLFIQGGGADGTHDDWDLKLVDSLRRELGPTYEVIYPRMPDEANPSYPRWKAALEEEVTKLHDGAILLGHSIGGTILINALGAHAPGVRLRGVFLVAAPFVGKGGWPSEDIESVADLGARLPAQVPVYLYHGSEDDTVPLEHVNLYANAIPQAVVRRLNGRNHQLNDDLSEVAADIRGLESAERPSVAIVARVVLGPAFRGRSRFRMSRRLGSLRLLHLAPFRALLSLRWRLALLDARSSLTHGLGGIL